MPQSDDVFDVVVIGGGAAGCSAAIAAHDAGARVLLVESQPRLGGSMALSGGYVFAAGTSVQAAAGIADTADAMYEYCALINGWRVDPPVLRTFCQQSAAGVEWLLSLGVRFTTTNLIKTGMETVPRGHRAEGGGAEIAECLERACRARDIEIAFGTAVDALVFDGGRAAGVRAGDDTAPARAVVIASGGFGHNRRLLEAHYPTAVRSDPWTWSVSAPGSLGVAVDLGEQAGASFAGHDQGLLIPVPSVVKTTTTRSAWVTLVNESGRRFIAEDAYHSVLTAAILAQGGVCHAIFDEAARTGAPPDPAYGDVLTGSDAPAPDTVVRAGTIAELAAVLGMDAGLLAHTAANVNRDAAVGVDRVFGKDPALLRPITSPPFYAVQVRPALVALTGYGLRIDERASVLDGADEPIPGPSPPGRRPATCWVSSTSAAGTH